MAPALVLALAAAVNLANPGWVSLKAVEFDVAQGEPAIPAGLRAPAPDADTQVYALVKVRGPVVAGDAAALRALGLDVVDFVQVATFVVRGRWADVQRARAL